VVTIPEGLFLVEGLQIIKRGIANDVFKFVPNLATLTFLEKFVNQKPQPRTEEPKAEVKEAAPAPRTRRKKAAAPPRTA
jgi:peptidylprolyl isomerase